MSRRVIATLTLVTLLASMAGCVEDEPTAPGRADAPAVGSAPPGAGPTTGAGAPPAPATCPSGAAATPLAELQGVADAGNSLWALLFPRGAPGLNPGVEEKIVWRMTGSGTLRIQATGPGGATIGPASDPIRHESSSWSRPGDEWGTTWNFPTAGCWTATASRSDGVTGTLTLRVE